MANSYILLDSALVPSIWYYLTFNSLTFEPLYRRNSAKIKSVIPYIIRLDKTTHAKEVNELLSKKAYQSGLIIQSQNTPVELADKLGYFYHVVNEKNEPFLRRFFDLRRFPQFVETLTEAHYSFLFDDETVFYYLDKDEMYYHCVYLENKAICFNRIGINELKEKIG